jgi:hypothetical protein
MPAEVGASFPEVRILGEWNKILDLACKELQLLKISAFPLSGEFPTNNHFTHCKPSLLLIIVQGLSFVNGFSQNSS